MSRLPWELRAWLPDSQIPNRKLFGMIDRDNLEVETARTAGIETIAQLLSSPREDILCAIIENPSVDETHILLLLKRKDLPGILLEEIARKKIWHGSYRVRFSLAAHPHTPRTVATRLLRELHLMDLVRVSRLPTTPPEVRRLAEDRILAQLPQVPLGLKLMLARRGSGRVAAGLIAHGPLTAMKVALDNAFLTEAQLLRTLAKEDITPQTIAAIARHKKWSNLLNVRVALVLHTHTPLESVLTFLRDLPRKAIQDLLETAQLPWKLHGVLRQELIRRDQPC
jgi:hypothetical protein